MQTYFQNSSWQIFAIIVIIGKFVRIHSSDAFTASIVSTDPFQTSKGRSRQVSSILAIGQHEDNENSTFKHLSRPNLTRGSYYGENNNSTIPHPTEVAAKLGVKPTKEASAKEWQNAWKVLKILLPVLHLFDRCKPVDSSLNLACIWWKALSGNDQSSPVYDDGLSYDILPSCSRLLVSKRLCNFFPRLHHANVELRTAYLDRAIKQVVANEVEKGKKIRLISFGAGYDLRSVKFLEKSVVDVAYELDLKQVVEAKEKLFVRLLKRRPWLVKIPMPKLIPTDLNDIVQVRQQLKEIVTKSDIHDYHTIFVFEGVMIYLDESIPSKLLKTTSSVLKDSGADFASLCFADRLENIPGGDLDAGIEELGSNGWEVIDWCPKPGLARHMGYARIN